MNMYTKNVVTTNNITSNINIEQQPYPINALPKIISEAVSGYREYGQQPASLIACSALANVSLACQTLANIRRDPLLISPVSIFFLVIADSGERKSAADQVFGQGIRQWEQNIREQLDPKIRTAQINHQAWKITKQALLLKIKKAKTPEERQDLRNDLISLTQAEPMMPLRPTLFFEDTTQEAIIHHLAYGWPSASLWSDEGGIVLNSQGLKNNASKFIVTLNGLWDGKSFSVHRKGSNSFTTGHRRLTLNLMLQPLLLQQLLARNGEVTRQSGFLARTLIAAPESTMGKRYYKEAPYLLNSLKTFNKRISDCLDSSLHLDHQGCKNIPVLSFSPAAKKTWVSFFNKIEEGLIDPGKWLSIRDFASKSAENAARLAALFHSFEGKEGTVSAETIQNAIQIAEWHLWETRRLLGEKLLTQTQQDAMALMQWFKDKNVCKTTPRYIQQFSPVRDKQRRNEAIAYLAETQYLTEKKINGKTNLMIEEG
jgi:hypothetical protein